MATDAKQYLISFLATLKGDKAVVGGLRRMEKAVQGQTKVMTGAKTATQDYGAVVGNLAKRALLTIPVWLLLRTVFMGLIRTIGDIVRSNVQFEEQMARVRTVMHGTATVIEADMARIKSTILDTALKSRLSIEKLAEGFYFLRTANLSSQQALDAFIPAVNLAVGTGNELAETTRALAGVYNTMGKAITENMTDLEAFNHIADVLAFTYATQDVQLSELIASYSKFAPYVSGLDDSFTDVVTTLGFLNTRLLRAGRAGRLTGRSIIQLSKNAEKLASIFGITFDADKPINFVNTMRQIHQALNTGTKLTEKQSRAIQETFATRGAVPIRLLLESFDEWNDALKLAGENAEGFAEKMNDIRMGTVSAQAQRMKSIFSVLGNELISGASGSGSFAETLKVLNDVLAQSRNGFRLVGTAIGYVTANLAQGAVALETMVRNAPNTLELLNPFRVVKNFEKLNDALDEVKKRQLGLISWSEYTKQQEAIVEKTKQEETIREQITDATKEAEESESVRTGELKKQQAILANQVKLLKIAGVHEAHIAEFKLNQLDSLTEYMTLEDEEAERLKLQNGLIEAQAKLRKEIVTSMQTSSLALLRAMGGSESQILEIKIRQLQYDRETIGAEQYLLNLTKLRRQQQLALLNEKKQEEQTAVNLYLAYKKADEFEKSRIRRLTELRQLSPSKLAKAYKENMYDQRIIDQYFSYFSEVGKDAVNKIRLKLAKSLGLDLSSPDDTPLPKKGQIESLINPESTGLFWDSWDRRARTSLDKFAQDWSNLSSKEGGLGAVGQGITDRIAFDQNVDMKTVIENLEVKIPIDSIDQLADNTAEAVKETLLTNEDFQKKFIDKIREKL